MTCHCPKYMCYYRADCRRVERQKRIAPAKVRQTQKLIDALPPIDECRLNWLRSRHQVLTEKLAEEGLSPYTQSMLRSALALIDEAIARRSK